MMINYRWISDDGGHDLTIQKQAFVISVSYRENCAWGDLYPCTTAVVTEE